MKEYPKEDTILNHSKYGKCEVQKLYEFFHPHYREMGLVFVKFLDHENQPIMLVDLDALEEI